MPISIGFSKPFFEAVADKFQKHKQMTFAFAMLMGILMSCLLLVPSVNNQGLSGAQQMADKYCPKNETATILRCIVSTTDEKIVSSSNCSIKTGQFWNISDCSEFYHGMSRKLELSKLEVANQS